LSSVSQNVLKFYQQLIGEERRIPFIFDGFHFCRSRVIGLNANTQGIKILHGVQTNLVVLKNFSKERRNKWYQILSQYFDKEMIGVSYASIT
jgi:hypothetical protein